MPWLIFNLVAVVAGYIIAPKLIPQTDKSNVHDDADLCADRSRSYDL